MPRGVNPGLATGAVDLGSTFEVGNDIELEKFKCRQHLPELLLLASVRAPVTTSMMTGFVTMT